VKAIGLVGFGGKLDAEGYDVCVPMATCGCPSGASETATPGTVTVTVTAGGQVALGAVTVMVIAGGQVEIVE
jgi:hypothetical protein